MRLLRKYQQKSYYIAHGDASFSNANGTCAQYLASLIAEQSKPSYFPSFTRSWIMLVRRHVTNTIVPECCPTLSSLIIAAVPNNWNFQRLLHISSWHNHKSYLSSERWFTAFSFSRFSKTNYLLPWKVFVNFRKTMPSMLPLISQWQAFAHRLIFPPFLIDIAPATMNESLLAGYSCNDIFIGYISYLASPSNRASWWHHNGLCGWLVKLQLPFAPQDCSNL